ncbi:MAG: glycosyltransferase family 39 protein [Acidobacteria bacterium]|nr:glycosyltransferase family 39 protein [Acidobacteriota bacterium]
METIQKVFSAKNLPFIVKAGIGILLSLLVPVVVSRTIYPFDLGHLEAFCLMPAEHLLAGKNPFSFAFTPPYSMVTYGPAFYVLLAVGLKIFGFQFWWGRILSTLGFAVCVWAVARIAKHLTGDRDAMLAAAFLALAFFPGQTWVAMMRSDLIALAFSLSALCLVLTTEKFGAGRLLAVVLLATAAFFTKQTFLLHVGVIGLRFLQLGRRREFAAYAGGVGLLTAGVMFFLDYTSDGGYLWQHFLHARNLPFGIEILPFQFVQLLKLPTTLVFGAALLIFLVGKPDFLGRANRADLISALRRPETLVLFYFAAALAAAVMSAGRIGANINYFLEATFLMALVFGLIYHDFKRKSRPALASALVVLFILGGVVQLVRTLRGEYFRWESRPYYEEVTATAARFVTPGSVCVSVFPEIARRAGCAYYFDDYAEYTRGWEPSLDAIFDREIKSGKFPVVIWNDPDFHEKYPEYEPVKMTRALPERFPPPYLYVRKPAP